MQKLLNEWRAYLNEDKKSTTYSAGTIQCPVGVKGVGGYVNTTKGRKLVTFCPSESEAKANAGMKKHKKAAEQTLLIIKNSKETLDYLEKTLKNYSYEGLLDGTLENMISDVDPFGPNQYDFKMDYITKENYDKRFELVMGEVKELLDPLKKIEDINVDMQIKLADIYNNTLKLFTHIKEYHKARIAY